MPRTRRHWILTTLVFAMMLCGSPAAHADAPPLASTLRAEDIPVARRTPQALYVTAREAHAALETRKDVLLIDVRTPGETIFSGIATPMARNIPYLVIEDGHAFDAGARRYKLVANPDFPKAIELLTAERKLGANAVLILYCASGDRSAKAAALLANSGVANVYTMVDGFDGDNGANATSPATGMGWSPAGLPVTNEMTEDQAYHSPSM